ncbi:MAG: cytochrome c-type biogenesis protein CcmH [Candidatus Binatia bacterium]
MARLVLVAALLLPAIVHAAGVTTKEIEEALTCQCGCGLTVHSCNHLSCPSGIPLRQEVAALVGDGLGRGDILLRFRDKYGEKILAAPTTEGFNLVAWVLPFLLVGAGVVVVVGVVRRWTARPIEARANEPPEALSPEDRRRLESELRREDV